MKFALQHSLQLHIISQQSLFLQDDTVKLQIVWACLMRFELHNFHKCLSKGIYFEDCGRSNLLISQLILAFILLSEKTLCPVLRALIFLQEESE